jgi:hypothetical protein
MKTLLTILSLTLLMGCAKEDAPVSKCNCGIIANDGIDLIFNPNGSNLCYWLEIRNDCSGNKKKFCFDNDVWLSNYVGDQLCVTNEEW